MLDSWYTSNIVEALKNICKPFYKTKKLIFQVAKLRKPDGNSGLGIALEGTVEVEDGREVRPHHYIRDIQIGGPVGINGILQRGDELLEVSSRSNTSKYHRICI